MIVSELIALLQKMPPDMPVHINDETGGKYIKDIDCVFFMQANEEYGDEAAVVIVVEPQE
jgi:hypothetical protein